MQISTIKNQNLEKPFRSIYLIGPKLTFWGKKFWDISQKNLVPRMLSQRENVRTSNSGENRRKRSDIFFENLPGFAKDLI